MVRFGDDSELRVSPCGLCSDYVLARPYFGRGFGTAVFCCGRDTVGDVSARRVNEYSSVVNG